MPVFSVDSMIPSLAKVPLRARMDPLFQILMVAWFATSLIVVVVPDTVSNSDPPVPCKVPPVMVPPRSPTLPPLAAITPVAPWFTEHRTSSRPPLVASIVPSLVLPSLRNEIVLPE